MKSPHDRFTITVTPDSDQRTLRMMAEAFDRIRKAKPGFVGPTVVAKT